MSGGTPGRTVRHYPSAHQQRAWQAMRILLRFTVPDLLVTCEGMSLSLAARYVRTLGHCGYLRLVQRGLGAHPGSRNQWQLVRNTGPLPPVRRARGCSVFDPNTGVAWGKGGLPIADPSDHAAVARALLAKLAEAAP